MVVRKRAPGRKYVPAKGDVIYLNLDPRTGHEQSGHRPALVLSERQFNEKTGLAVVCPMTTKNHSSPFEVLAGHLPNGDESFVMSHQIRTVDWVARKAAFKNKATGVVVANVLQRVSLIIGLKNP